MYLSFTFQGHIMLFIFMLAGPDIDEHTNWLSSVKWSGQKTYTYI